MAQAPDTDMLQPSVVERWVDSLAHTIIIYWPIAKDVTGASLVDWMVKEPMMDIMTFTTTSFTTGVVVQRTVEHMR